MTYEDKQSSHNIIVSLEAKEQRNRPISIKIADWLTSSFGSIWFLVGNGLFFVIWIGVNTGHIQGIPAFDPYPFTFLTMVVSLEAIFLSIIVLMSQSRQSYISTLREELDMQVNLIAEREITKTLELLRLILQHHKIEYDDAELNEMIKKTDISYIERQLETQLKRVASKNQDIAGELGKDIEKTVVKTVGSDLEMVATGEKIAKDIGKVVTKTVGKDLTNAAKKI